MITEDEKAKIRHHLGYPALAQNTQIGLGFPAAGHTMFILETAMNEVRPSGLAMVRRSLNECECIEAQLSQSRRQRLQTAAVESIVFRGRDELSDLEDQYNLWTGKLADNLGCTKQPFSHTHARGDITVIDSY